MKRFVLTLLALALTIPAHSLTIVHGPAYFGVPELPMTQPIIIASQRAIAVSTNVQAPFVGSFDSINTNTNTEMPYNGTVSKLHFDVNVAPGAADSGKSWTATLYKNGSATALTCTIFETATQAEDLVNTVSYIRGDTLRWLVTGSGTPTAAFHQLSALSVSNAAADSLVTWGSGFTAMSKTAAASWPLNNTVAGASGDVVMPTSGTFDRMGIRLNSSSNGVLVTTLMVNGVDSALTCTAGVAATSASDDTHSVHVNAGDVVRITTNPTTPYSGNLYYLGSMRFKPDINGESLVTTTSVSPSATSGRYYAVGASGGSNAITTPTDRIRGGRAPIEYTMKKLRVRVSTAPSPGNFTLKSYKNDGLGTLAALISASSTQGEDVSNSDSFSVGDLAYFRLDTGSSPVTSSMTMSAVIYVAP